MKPLSVLSIAVLIISCNINPSSNDPAQITGTYTHDASGEFSIASDTLIINLYNRNGKTYTIQRNTGFNRIVEGKLQQREFFKETMTATYDEESQQLRETKSGRIFLFPVEKNQLMIGSVAYKKIK